MCLLWSDIPFSIARNNSFFQPAIDAIVIACLGYKAPSYYDFRGCLPENEKAKCSKRLGEFRGLWAQTGCILTSNGWTEQKGRTLVNFLVNCPKGAMFMKFVDASLHIEDAMLLYDLFDVIIQEVGPQHVVQVIMYNVDNYVVAGKMIMERHPSILWTPCATH